MVTRSNVNLEFLVLRRALPLTKQELGEEEPELSRTSKGTVTNQTKEHLKSLQDKTTEFTRKTRRSVDIQKLRDKKTNLSKNGRILLIYKRMIFQIG